MVACSPFGPAGEFAAARHGALTRRQAAIEGLTPIIINRLLRDRVLEEPVPGVLVVVGAPPTWRQRLYVATLASRGAGAVGFRSAAALHGLDGYSEGPIELLVPSHRRIRLPDLVVHRGPYEQQLDITEVDGIACTSVARTLCDIATVDSSLDLKVAFEAAWRAGHSLEWFRQTATRLHLPGRTGPRRLLAPVDAAQQRGTPTESALEVKVEQVLDALPGVVRQHRVHRADGSFVARVDFAIPELRIAIEAHSRQHHFGHEAVEDDAVRESELQAEGWIVRFVTERQRRRPDELRRSLARLVAARSRPT